MNEEDISAIHQAKQNPKDYDKIYLKYADKVFNYFWYRTGHNKELSEDLMQETFLKAYEHLPRFNNRGYSYLTYLLSIAHNILVDYFRKPKTIPLEEAGDIPFEITGNLERKSDAEALWRAVQKLSPRERDILLMKYQEEMKTKDIARAIGATENAVKLVLSRVRKALHDHPYLQDMALYGSVNRKQTRPKFLQDS